MLRWTVLLVGFSMAAWAADDDWGNLSRLQSGDRIDIVDTSGKHHEGTFAGSGATNIVVNVAGTQTPLDKSAVARVSRKGKAHRIRNAAIFGAIGAVIGAGALRFGIACAETDNGCRNTQVATIAGGAAGAALGAALPSRYETIYRIKRP